MSSPTSTSSVPGNLSNLFSGQLQNCVEFLCQVKWLLFSINFYPLVLGACDVIKQLTGSVV